MSDKSKEMGKVKPLPVNSLGGGLAKESAKKSKKAADRRKKAIDKMFDR